MSTAVRVGVRPAHSLFERESGELPKAVRRIEELGLDRVWVGDHVSFHDGRGYDGLINAAVLAGITQRLEIQTSVYLLPLRHPVPTARQVFSVAHLAPGRFSFGVGVGGEDRREVAMCGVDPSTRGRRMDESLEILRPLLAGETVHHDGEFFALEGVRMLPTPAAPVPIIVGGRSTAALRRAAKHGDGWIGTWVSPNRFANATEEIAELARGAGRAEPVWRHAMLVWCGFGATVEAARAGVARMMEAVYKIPFDKFERYTPYGTPEDVAAALEPYVQAGCCDFNLSAVAADSDEALEGASRVRALLR